MHEKQLIRLYVNLIQFNLMNMLECEKFITRENLIMSGIVSTYRKLLELPLSLLVKNNPIPEQPIEELRLNLQQPVVYVLSLQCTLLMLN